MDEELIISLYEKYRIGIYRFALSILGDSQLAEDVMQDTFLKAWKRTDILYCNSEVQSWLYHVAKNACYDILRKRKREQPDTIFQETAFSNKPDEVESELTFLEMISGLGEKDKMIVSLRIIGELPHKEIAKIMGMTVHSTKKRYERAIHKLRIQYEREEK